MKKKIMAISLILSAVLGNSLTAFASPETMPDGTLFDADYYAVTYPDVAAAVGTDEKALYQHYVSLGKEEGRNAISPETNLNATSTWWRGKTEEVPDGIVTLPINYMGIDMFYEEDWNKLSEEQKLAYLYEREQLVNEGKVYDIDIEALIWWVNTSFDDNTKFDFLNRIKSTCSVSSLWVINSQLPYESKIQYFRTHFLEANSLQVYQWWFDNVGAPLTMEQTTIVDADNYSNYMRLLTNDFHGVDSVRIGKKRYVLSKKDIDKAVSEGKITYEDRSIYVVGSSNTNGKIRYYYANSTDIGYKLWYSGELQ